MRPELVTFECAGCNETVTGPESAMHYCEECSDGPFCKKCWKEHKKTCKGGIRSRWIVLPEGNGWSWH